MIRTHAMTQLGTGAQRGAFDEWVDTMRAWQREIDVTPDRRRVLTEKFSDRLDPEIGYGRYAGERRWESVGRHPGAADQGRAASAHRLAGRLGGARGRAGARAPRQRAERARPQAAGAPHDRGDAPRLADGVPPGHLFRRRRPAARRASCSSAARPSGEALLEMFNVKLNWVDVFSWHNWGDRVGKYQLTMFAGCGFAPFARSIGPMLREESFHLAMGHQGMQRICRRGPRAGRDPPALHRAHDVDLLRRLRR